MAWINDFVPDYSEGVNLTEGEYAAKIAQAANTFSNSGKRMFKIKMDIQGVSMNWFIVEGEWFNKNFTRFCSCFKINPNNFEAGTWVNHTGRVYIKKDESNDKYFKIDRLLYDFGNGQKPVAPQSAAPKPAAPPAAKRAEADDFDDDIPF